MKFSYLLFIRVYWRSFAVAGRDDLAGRLYDCSLNPSTFRYSLFDIRYWISELDICKTVPLADIYLTKRNPCQI